MLAQASVHLGQEEAKVFQVLLTRVAQVVRNDSIAKDEVPMTPTRMEVTSTGSASAQRSLDQAFEAA
eukprot:6227541-Karenia_brevis.AAC.1